MADSEEIVALYDAAGTVVGSTTRSRMRREGLWHAVSSVLVLSGDRERVYVHRRTDTKDVAPGMHDCWAGGVVAAGEDPDSTAARELSEELGVRDTELRYLFRTTHDLDGVRFHAFLYETAWDGPVRHQPEEVADGGWMPLAQLWRRLQDPQWSFVPDGRQFIGEWRRFRGV